MKPVVSMLDECRAKLLDSKKRYWTDAELIGYLNDGRTMLYTAKPQSYEVTEAVTLEPGAMQTVPQSSRFLFGIHYNVTARSRRNITPQSREMMGRVRPRWRSESPSDEIVHYVYDEREPAIFEVYPPARDGVKVMMTYARPPEPYSLASYLALNLNQAETDYASALLDWMLYRAWEKGSDASPDQGQRARMAMESAMAKIGLQTDALAKVSPNTTAVGGTVSTA